MNPVATDLTAPPQGVTLVLRYAAFAALAMGVNLSVQYFVAQFYLGPLPFVIKLGCGTVAGLLPKYILDKIWIFDDRSGGHAQKFTLYTLMSVFTTLIFWGSEGLFHWLGGEPLDYLGGAVGLVVGYVVKYHLDRRFVFGAR